MRISLKFFLSFVVLISFSECEKLTDHENAGRLYYCGRQFPPVATYPNGVDGGVITLDSTKESWLVKVSTSYSKKQNHPTVGSFISSRHILTSSQAILVTNGVEPLWVTTGLKWIDNCDANEKHAKVPDEVTQNIIVTTIGNSKKFTVKVAYLLQMCPFHYDDFKTMYTPMVLEVNEQFPAIYPCYSELSVNSLLNRGVSVFSYGFQYPDYDKYEGEVLKYRDLQITEVANKQVATYNYKAPGDRGGPLLLGKISAPRATIIGIGSTPGNSENSPNTYFYQLTDPNMYGSICKVAGICEKGNITYVETTTPVTTLRTSTEILDLYEPDDPNDKSVEIEEEAVKTEIIVDARGNIVVNSDDLFVGPDIENRGKRIKLNSWWMVSVLFLIYLIK